MRILYGRCSRLGLDDGLAYYQYSNSDFYDIILILMFYQIDIFQYYSKYFKCFVICNSLDTLFLSHWKLLAQSDANLFWRNLKKGHTVGIGESTFQNHVLIWLRLFWYPIFRSCENNAQDFIIVILRIMLDT